MTTATGFDFEPLPDGNVLIEFFGDDGTTINKQQVVTAEVIRQAPFVAALLDVAMRKGPEAAREIVERLNKVEGMRNEQLHHNTLVFAQGRRRPSVRPLYGLLHDSCSLRN